jgi:hypothetical protein
MELTLDQQNLMAENEHKSHMRVIETVYWLQDRNGGTFEDWGCGAAWVKQYVTRMQYVGVDRAPMPSVDVVQDLVHRRQPADVIFLHQTLSAVGLYWEMVLTNAFHNFQHRMVIVEKGGFDHARLLQLVQSAGRPFTIEILPDGRRLYFIER